MIEKRDSTSTTNNTMTDLQTNLPRPVTCISCRREFEIVSGTIEDAEDYICEVCEDAFKSS